MSDRNDALAVARQIASEVADLLSTLQTATNEDQDPERLQALTSEIEAKLARLERLMPPENEPHTAGVLGG